MGWPWRGRREGRAAVPGGVPRFRSVSPGAFLVPSGLNNSLLKCVGILIVCLVVFEWTDFTGHPHVPVPALDRAFGIMEDFDDIEFVNLRKSHLFHKRSSSPLTSASSVPRVSPCPPTVQREKLPVRVAHSERCSPCRWGPGGTLFR